MGTLFVVVGFFGAIAALIWLVVAAIRKKPKKSALIALVACVVLFFVGSALLPTPEESSTGSAAEESTEESAEQSSRESETAEQPEASSTEEPTSVSDNPLIAAELQTSSLKNGYGEDIDGEYAYIEVSKDDLKSVTEELFEEFVDQRVKNSSYNWVSIMCNDGTGITFPGSSELAAEYGEQDSDGAIKKLLGNIYKEDNGYTYEKFISYSSGMYKVGDDIKAREYILISDSSTAYFQVASDSTGTLESIVTNDNFDGSRYITVSDGQYLTLKGCTAYPAKYIKSGKIMNAEYSNDCMYKVGVDIDAGEYKVTATSGNGYYEVDSDSKGDLYSIVSNDLFDTSVYVSVSDGQYLKLQGAKLEQ